MELIAAALAALLFLSLAGTALLAFRLHVARQDHASQLEAARKEPARQLSVTAEALLHDLTAGAAVVRIERINPQDLWLRSPRT